MRETRIFLRGAIFNCRSRRDYNSFAILESFYSPKNPAIALLSGTAPQFGWAISMANGVFWSAGLLMGAIHWQWGAVEAYKRR
jgi:hypothetical protein